VFDGTVRVEHPLFGTDDRLTDAPRWLPLVSLEGWLSDLPGKPKKWSKIDEMELYENKAIEA
jgi:hypothetical protein